MRMGMANYDTIAVVAKPGDDNLTTMSPLVATRKHTRSLRIEVSVREGSFSEQRSFREAEVIQRNRGHSEESRFNSFMHLH